MGLLWPRMRTLCHGNQVVGKWLEQEVGRERSKWHTEGFSLTSGKLPNFSAPHFPYLGVVSVK